MNGCGKYILASEILPDNYRCRFRKLMRNNKNEIFMKKN